MTQTPQPLNISQAKQLIEQINKIKQELKIVEAMPELHRQLRLFTELSPLIATLSTTKLWVQDKIEELKKDIEFLKDLMPITNGLQSKYGTMIGLGEIKPLKLLKIKIKLQLQAKETELKQIEEVKGVLDG